jgi:hypothetical protein
LTSRFAVSVDILLGAGARRNIPSRACGELLGGSCLGS